MDNEPMTLEAHDARSDERTHKLAKKIENLKESMKMEPVNVFTNPSGDGTAAMLAAIAAGGNNMGGAGAGLGAGLGGGLLGGILGGALLNRGGLLGGGVDGAGVVTPAMLTSGLASVIDSNQNTTLLQSVGDVKAAVPLAESQVQLALAGVQNDINRAISGSQSDLTAMMTTNASAQALANQLTNQNIANAIASSLASQGAIKESVAAYGVANLTATKDAQFATTTAINASTKEIIAALNDQNTANLQRQLAVAESALLERNAALRARETEINITNTNTATAQQTQNQIQAQQQFQILANLSATVANLANDIQVVRQGQTIFNSGTMAASGTQAAANTKVN